MSFLETNREYECKAGLLTRCRVRDAFPVIIFILTSGIRVRHF